jgi:hypothetical protein
VEFGAAKASFEERDAGDLLQEFGEAMEDMTRLGGEC